MHIFHDSLKANNILTNFYFKIPISLGILGVNLFFLISGFVIPISLEKYGSWKFLIQRFFRLYPVYIICSILFLCITFIYHKMTGLQQLSISIKDIFISLFTGAFSWNLGNVIWTLVLEFKFYFLSAFVMISLNFFKLRTKNEVGMYDILLISCVALMLKTEKIFFLFMIGLLYFLYYKKRINLKTLFFFTLIYAIFTSTYYTYRSDIFTCMLSLSIFNIYYFGQNFIKKNKLLSFIADISYPLYLVHSGMYYVLSYLMFFHQLSYLKSLFIVVNAIFLISYLIHKSVERFFIKFGKIVITNF